MTRGLGSVSLREHDGISVATITGEVDISNVEEIAATLSSPTSRSG